jgi:hypothetical protein
VDTKAGSWRTSRVRPCGSRDATERSDGGCSVSGIGQFADPPPDRPGSLSWLRRLWRLVPGRIRRYFEARFTDVSKSEATGYAVWTAMGVVVGVPEIWAAIEGDDFYWPTISTTIGHLQERWPVVALLPVAAIVMAGYSVYRIRGIGDTVVQADLQALGRTAEGRLVKQDVANEQLVGGGVPATADVMRDRMVAWYFVFATALVVGASLLSSSSDTRFSVGYVLYSLIAIFWIVVPNLAAYFLRKDFPFTTLFFTIRALGRRLQFVAALVAALLVILLLHLAFYPWPSLP